MLKVVINGALGKMGREVGVAVRGASDMAIERELDIANNLEEYLSRNQVDVVVDFTQPEGRMDRVRAILNNGASAVIGTTGFTDEDLAEIEKLCKAKKKGCIIAQNFAIGSVLLMKFAQQAAKYFSTAEIIEYHHLQLSPSLDGGLQWNVGDEISP